MNEPDVDFPYEVIDDRVFIYTFKMNHIFLLENRNFKNLIPNWGSATIQVRGCCVRDTSVRQSDERVHETSDFCVSYKMAFDYFDGQDPKWIRLQLFLLFKISYFSLLSIFIFNH